jgi:uncharacterized lipoprotein YbaY/heat shock protein HslJ
MGQREFGADAPNIEFDRAQKRVSGSSGCNRFTGAFEIDGSALRLSRIAGTRRACLDAELQRVETSFLKLLGTATRFEVQGDTLRLYAGERSVLVFRGRVHGSQTPTPPPPGSADLSGTSWQLVRFRSSDDTTLVPDDRAKYTVAFGNDGRVSVRIDCNRGSGSWKSGGPNQLRFGPLALTRVMCPPGSLYERVARDWTAVRSYLVKDGHLFLSLMADGGIYEFEPTGGAGPEGLREARVTGTVSYRQRSALKPGAVVEVKLLDVSRADARSKTIAEQTIRPEGRQVPIAFELTYDPRRIAPRGRYAIQARILEGGKVRFRNTAAYLVITGGRPNEVNVVVSPVGR